MKTTVRLTDAYTNIISHMCYAAYKLWNVCNYERHNYKDLTLPVDYPDWYYQKKAHKDDIWFKQLPSQTAQEICKQLDKAWKSFYVLKKKQGIENPRPPRYKHEGMAVTYMQNAIHHDAGSDQVRLSLPRKLKQYMSESYGICETYLYLKNGIFENTETIKQIRIYPPVHGECNVIVVHEIPDAQILPDNGKYLSIDLGLHNLMTCYDPSTGESFIAGRRYLALCHYYNKEISWVQSQWSKLQSRQGVKHPKSSAHIKRLYRDRQNALNDYLHKVVNAIVQYCVKRDIHVVVAGDITNIRKKKNFGSQVNQQFHALPYKKLYTLLGYKLAMRGILFVKQKESYSSQTSPLAPEVCRVFAKKSNRVKRGLYKDGEYAWNADVVGAFNILRLYFQERGIPVKLDPQKIRDPYVLKVAA